MAFFDKMLNAMRLNTEDDEDDFYEDEYMEDEEYEAPARKRSFRKERAVEEEEPFYERKTSGIKERDRSPEPRTSSKITPMRPSRRSAQQGGNVPMEVCVIKPSSVEDAREITETLLNNRTVVLNLEGLDLDVAQRIIDFTSGSCFAIDGNLQKISNFIFIVTPAAVDISGDFQNIMDAFDSSSIQTDI